jgi:arsenite methyltransferase
MALTCPIGFDTQKLRDEVSKMYSRFVDDPSGEFHFHSGPQFAADLLGYELAELEKLPEDTTRSFAGVGNPLSVGPIEAGSTVLDVGCGAGMDLLLAATRAGATGKAIGVDMTTEMLDRTRESVAAMGFDHVDLRQGDAESLPVDDASVDVVISNGVINLTTDKSIAFGEISRVLKPGGKLMLADIVVKTELSEGIRNDIDLWAS